MPRKALPGHFFDAIYQTLVTHPGRTSSQVAYMLGVHPQKVRSALLTMEHLGYLLAEDGQGRLYPFANHSRSETHARYNSC